MSKQSFECQMCRKVNVSFNFQTEQSFLIPYYRVSNSLENNFGCDGKWSDVSFVFYVAEYHPGSQSMRLKEDHDYYHQIQGQLHCTNCNAADLIVWTTKDSVIIRIMRDPKWITNIEKLIEFYFSQFIPYLQN